MNRLAEPGGAEDGAPAPAGAAAAGYGGFRLGPFNLALPMAALREVVPRGDLSALPCPARCVVGAISLRGVLVPVVDLRLVLGADAAAATAYPCVIVMVHAGRILGLLADGVTGVFTSQPGSLNHANVADPVAAVLAGSIRRDDDGSQVSLLSPAALSCLHQVPMVDDPEPGRQRGVDDAARRAETPVAVPVMLVRCGRLPLALEALSVQATLSDPQLRPSVLARGHCLGVIEHAGALVPAVDLLALCGLGALAADERGQAFVVQLPAGRVALLVSEVIDVVCTEPDDVVPVPAHALAQPALFAGALPGTALAADVVQRAGVGGNPFLLIDGPALKRHADIVGLSATNTPLDSRHGPGSGLGGGLGGGAEAAGTARCSMLTYALAGESATPLAQISEILPYQPEAAVFGGQGAMLGLVVHGGQSVPVMCLSQLTGLPPPELSPAASVLVVQAGGQRMGFAVPQLRTIEPADWPAEADDDDGAAASRARAGAPLSTRQLAKVGHGDGERLLPVLDLRRLALALQARG